MRAWRGWTATAAATPAARALTWAEWCATGPNGQSPMLDFGSTGARELAQGSFSSITSAWLRLHMVGGAVTCIGDSGAPSLVGGTNAIVGIVILEASLSGGQCQSQPWDIRVDTSSARTFLGQYVTLP
jgi:hypothetical protein